LDSRTEKRHEREHVAIRFVVINVCDLYYHIARVSKMNCKHRDRIRFVRREQRGRYRFNVYICFDCDTWLYIQMKDDTTFDCLDCSADTSTRGIQEYYMIHKPLWLQANPQDDGMLCIGCLENRIGRKLNANDFISCPVNTDDWPSSERKLNRLGYV
jgi:hypothetical protein